MPSLEDQLHISIDTILGLGFQIVPLAQMDCFEICLCTAQRTITTRHLPRNEGWKIAIYAHEIHIVICEQLAQIFEPVVCVEYVLQYEGMFAALPSNVHKTNQLIVLKRRYVAKRAFKKTCVIYIKFT